VDFDKFKEMQHEQIKFGVRHILHALIGEGRWETDENFKDTPRRVANYFQQASLSKLEREVLLENCTPKTFSMCPHHLLPVEYDVVIAYLPSDVDGKITVLGASKLARIADILARSPILQEDYVDRIVDTLNSRMRIDGCAVLVSGVHMCMRCRGIRANGPYVTPYMDGCFRDNQKVREEFYNAIQYVKR